MCCLPPWSSLEGAGLIKISTHSNRIMTSEGVSASYSLLVFWFIFMHLVCETHCVFWHWTVCWHGSFVTEAFFFFPSTVWTGIIEAKQNVTLVISLHSLLWLVVMRSSTFQWFCSALLLLFSLSADVTSEPPRASVWNDELSIPSSHRTRLLL